MPPWSEWEDWRAGMYLDAATPELVEAAARLLSDPDQFYEVAREMLREWPGAAHQNLSNMWSGRNAWVGQASCMYAVGAPGAATREAWGRLSNPQQAAANAVARTVRAEWERGRDGAEALFADD